MAKKHARSKGAKGTYDKKSARIDFSTWNMYSDGKTAVLLEKLTNTAIREAFDIAVADYECDAGFALGDWGGDGKRPNPDTIDVWLPLGAKEWKDPKWSFSLQDMVREMIISNQSGDGGPIEDEQARRAFADVSAHLRRLASMLDDALAREATNATH